MQRPLYITRRKAFRAGSGFSPTSISGFELWLDASQEAYNDNDAVDPWSDQSGNNNDASAGVSPTFKTNIIGTESVVRFDGTNDYLNLGSGYDGLTALSCFVVIKRGATGDQGVFIGSQNFNGWAFEVKAANNLGFSKAGVLGITSTGTIADTNVHIVAIVWTGTQGKFIIDGSAESNQSLSVSFSGGGTYGIGDMPGQGELLNGDIAQILLYDSALSDADISNINTYLNDKYSAY